MSQTPSTRADYVAYIVVEYFSSLYYTFRNKQCIVIPNLFHYTDGTAAFFDSQQQCWQDKVSSLPQHLTWLADPTDVSDILVLISHFGFIYILWLPMCQWSIHEKYDKIYHMNHQKLMIYLEQNMMYMGYTLSWAVCVLIHLSHH